MRSLEIFRIWEEVFGGRERLIRVLPVQSGNAGVIRGVCGFREAHRHADAMATAPYMPYTVGRGRLADPALVVEMAGWSVERVLDHFEAHAFSNALHQMEGDKALADEYGLAMIAYEGGQHMVAMLRDAKLVQAIATTMHAANRHPRMGGLYRPYFARWRELGGGTFCHFSSVGGWSNHGAWGLAEYYDSTPADSPKLAALLETAAAWGQPVARP